MPVTRGCFKGMKNTFYAVGRFTRRTATSRSPSTTSRTTTSSCRWCLAIASTVTSPPRKASSNAPNQASVRDDSVFYTLVCHFQHRDHISFSDVVEFDNSFSYIRSKKIWYSITVEKPKPSEEDHLSTDL